jgi:preprotein translocase subunit SecG
MSQIFQQPKLKGCVWLLNKITIITVAILSIGLLMLDLMAEKQDRFWQIVLPYGMLLILNSKLLISAICKTRQDDGILIYWIVIYAASMLLNCVGIAVMNKYEYWIPANSKTATEFVIDIMDLDPVKQLSIGFYITVGFLIIMTVALCVTVLVDSSEDQVHPILPVVSPMPIQRPIFDQPPKYSSEVSLPNYNTALQHEVVERA